MRPQKEDYIPYFDYYINLIPEADVISALKNNHQSILQYFKSIPSEKIDYAYAEAKWTVKQLINHILDTERILSYRALRFGRGDGQLLPGFEEDEYVANAFLKNTTLEIQLEEFDAIRRSTILLFQQFSDNQLLLKGQMASGVVNVLALGYMICGHTQHHVNIIKERYL
jgi:hypothetical protein